MSKSLVLYIILLLCCASNLFSQQDASILCSNSRKKEFKSQNSFTGDYPGDSTIDVTYYKLVLKVTTTPDFLNGIVTVNATSLQNGLNTFFLDFEDNMVVDSVISNGTSLTFSQSDDELHITLDQTANKNDNISVVITYHGLPDITGLGSFEFGENQGVPAIWTLSEPYGAKTWFPNKDNPSDKADSSDVWITVADNLTGVSNGDLTETINNGDGTKTYKWRSRYPIAPYLISLAIADYSIYETYYHYSPSESMLVINYIYPQNLNSIKSLLDQTPSMIDIMSGYFGPYPFLKEKYGHAEFGVLAGMEHQTISSMGAFFDGIIVHELTHQWFGDKITCAKWEDIWVNEGFAVYGEALYQEATAGKEAYYDVIKSNMSRAKDAVGTIYVQNINSIDEIFDGDRTYAKGGVVIHMLRGVMGDENFFRTLKAYMSDTSLAYGSATIRDFQHVAETVSGTNLSYFFDEWLYGENYPRYVVDWYYDLIQGNTYQVSVEVKQSVNTLPQFFTMPIDMKINTSLGDTTVRIFNNAQDQIFNFTIEGKPLTLDFDPDNYILKEQSGNTHNVPITYTLAQNYPNPFNPGTTITYELGNVSNVQLNVYDITGRLVSRLVNQKQREGSYVVEFDGSSLASGVYFYRLEAENTTVGSDETFTAIKKMILLK
ncbi:MAG: T9SS type A sorting domain-containing protein [Ignavibacteriae bacterium]|nr:T9SS type A sorting domain-containing protein [Ignavibacteriota bacterium]MCB9242942.1 T9SS type A sorting domain-containing protein [Ignavibacteriales bacterium]